MKNKIHPNIAVVMLILLATVVLSILFQKNIDENTFLVLKMCLVCPFFLAAFLFWTMVKDHEKLFLSSAKTLKICEDLKKILFDLRDGTKTFYEEKRGAQRIKDCVRIKIISKGFNEFVKTLDLSETGACVRTDKKLLPDSVIDLSIYLSLFPQPINIQGRVARVYESEKDMNVFDVGIEFLSVSDLDKEKLKETVKVLGKDQNRETPDEKIR